MLSLKFSLLFALLVAVCLAVPPPTRTFRRSPKLVGRSFVVPRKVNRKMLGKRRDPGQAMASAFRKYGWAPQAKSANATAAGNGTENGVVAALPEDNEALFLSPVSIGGQQLNLDFDTGSSDLWVFSTRLSQKAIGGHSAFNEKNSSTFQLMQDAEFLITYGDGSGAAGVVGIDQVDIGGSTVQKQAIEVATAVSRSFVEDANTDGLVGLAFGKLNTVRVAGQKAPQKTFFENVMPDLDMPVFTADLTNDTGGTYEFGKIDQAKFSGELTWVPVDSSKGFWQVDSKAFAVGGQVVQNPTGSPAIADTGTSLLLVDDNVATAYYSAVPGAENNAQVGGFIYPCSTQMPDFAVALGDYMANIPGDAVTFAAVDEANTTCFGGVQSNGGAGLQIYGDTMFKTQFVVFNGGNTTLGVAPKN